MAKRFTGTEIWKEDWFLEMSVEYKLFWYFMLSTCDHAGLFKVNVKVFCGLNGVKITPSIALKLYNSDKQRIREISTSLWLIEDFFVFQYGHTFNPNNKVHESIQRVYNQHNIKMTSIRGLQDLKDRVKDKDKDIDKEIEKGGMGENKKGIKFSEDFDKVYFADNSWQMLGSEQKVLAMGGDIYPSTIIKGSVY